jgi:hypothetical protein
MEQKQDAKRSTFSIPAWSAIAEPILARYPDFVRARLGGDWEMLRAAVLGGSAWGGVRADSGQRDRTHNQSAARDAFPASTKRQGCVSRRHETIGVCMDQLFGASRRPQTLSGA